MNTAHSSDRETYSTPYCITFLPKYTRFDVFLDFNSDFRRVGENISNGIVFSEKNTSRKHVSEFQPQDGCSVVLFSTLWYLQTRVGFSFLISSSFPPPPPPEKSLFRRVRTFYEVEILTVLSTYTMKCT